MLKRLYVHNYKCLVNFEINFDKDISLFLGANGSGKSTIFEVLDKLRRFIVNEESIDDIFDENDTPRWSKSIFGGKFQNIQFELDIDFNDDFYRYSLILSCISKCIIVKESLYCNEMQMLTFDGKNISYETPMTESVDMPVSGLVSRSLVNRYYDYFHESIFGDDRYFVHSLQDLFINKINPYQINSSFEKTNSKIKVDCSNFAEWFAHLNETNRRGISKFEHEMRDVLNGFDYFRIEQAGRAKILQMDFKNKTNKEIINYDFDELSEGQKVLIILYTLIYCTPDNSILCIDEPENFLALPEIQPWLNALRDQCAERSLQVILISHHPSLINFLAASSGYWFSREDNHTRVQRIKDKNEGGLSFAQLIELGWIYEG